MLVGAVSYAKVIVRTHLVHTPVHVHLDISSQLIIPPVSVLFTFSHFLSKCSSSNFKFSHSLVYLIFLDFYSSNRHRLQRWNRSRFSRSDPTVQPVCLQAGWPAKFIHFWPAEVSTFSLVIAQTERKKTTVYSKSCPLCPVLCLNEKLQVCNYRN